MTSDLGPVEFCYDCYALIPAESAALHRDWHLNQERVLDDLRWELAELRSNP